MTRVVVVGLDGATWSIIRPLVEQGYLPTLAALLSHSGWATLRSVQPPLSPPAWTSFMTGANPGKTRIFDFIGRAPDGGFRLVNGQWRALPSLWRLLSDAGYRVGVINVPMTYPPEPVNGVLIAGMDAPVKDRAIGHPPDIDHRLRKAGISYRVDVHPSRLIRQSPQRYLTTYVREVNRVAQEHGAVARWIWDRWEPDFLMVTFVNTDRIGHAAGKFLRDVIEGRPVSEAHPIVATYRTADAELGRLLDVVGEDVTLIVMSDHGFQPYDEVFNLNYWLKEQGWLALDERKLRPSRWGPLAPLWQRLQYKIRGYGHQNLLERAAFFRAIDWSRTRAYSFGAFGSIFVNVRGRDPQGIVESGAEYDHILQTLSEQLLDLRHPRDGKPIIRSVRRADEVYSGPYVSLGPDLLLETSPGFFIRNALDEYRPQLVYPAGRYGQRSLEHTGMHHPDGILLMKGPGIRPGHHPQAHILDLMPTILALYGLPVPSYVDGRPLEGWFTQPLRWQYRDVGPTEPDVQEGYSPEEADRIAQHLRELGYL